MYCYIIFYDSSKCIVWQNLKYTSTFSMANRWESSHHSGASLRIHTDSHSLAHTQFCHSFHNRWKNGFFIVVNEFFQRRSVYYLSHFYITRLHPVNYCSYMLIVIHIDGSCFMQLVPNNYYCTFARSKYYDHFSFSLGRKWGSLICILDGKVHRQNQCWVG